MEILAKLIIGIITIMIIFIFGCSTKVEYVPTVVEKEVLVPYMPDVPEINCEFTGDDSEVLKKLLNCLQEHKRVLGIFKHAKPNTSFNKETANGLFNTK